MSRTLIIIGLIFVVVGLLWPWLSKLGLGTLPGDIHIKRDGWSFYFPVTTSIVVSIVLTLILWFLRK